MSGPQQLRAVWENEKECHQWIRNVRESMKDKTVGVRLMRVTTF